MPLEIRRTVQQMLAEANSEIETLDVDEARALHGRPDVTFVDLRDPREAWREGGIPGAVPVTRGMLEFWIDPDSPYYKPAFADATEVILYCNKGWRSALAAETLLAMGCEGVAHLRGGLEQWLAAGGAIEALPERSR